MTWIWVTLAFVLVISLSLPASVGAIFRSFLKTPKPALLALLVGTMFFFFSNMFMEQRGHGLTETIALEISETGISQPAIIPILSNAMFVFFSIMIPACLARLGIMLVDKKRNKTPNRTSSIADSARSE